MNIKLNCFLNKYEKLIFEYLLEFFYFSKKNRIRLPIHTIKNDLNMVPDMMSYLYSLASKKIEYIKNENEIYYFDIISKYSIINYYLDIEFSKETFNLLVDEDTKFQIYSLIFRNKYSLKLLISIIKFKELKVTAQELKTVLDIEDGYTRSYDLENKLIKPIIEEIKSYLNIQINFEKESLKSENGGVLYNFSLDKINDKKINQFEESYEKIRNILVNVG